MGQTARGVSPLEAELGLTADYPIAMEQEPQLSRLGDLGDDQLFGVAVCVLVTSRYVRAKWEDPAAEPMFVHGLAPPGCGKTTLLNVTA